MPHMAAMLDNLTIELDDDEVEEETIKIEDLPGPPPRIGPPLKCEDVIHLVDDAVRIRDLPIDVRSIIIAQLQLPAYGSMKNWETVASKMGMDQDNIMGLCRQGSLCEALLEKMSTRPANDLLRAIAATKRVDTLYSIRKYLVRFEEHWKVESTRKNSETYSKAETDRIREGVGNVIVPQPTTTQSYCPPGKFILVTHYEVDKEEKKIFKWMMKNLRARAEPTGCPVLDIATALSEDNIYASMNALFRNATHIVVCISPAYTSEIADRSGEPSSEGTEQTVAMRILLHGMTNSEYMQNGQNNRRFRLVLMGGSGSSILPLGWPRTTLWYTFPEGHKQLFARLLDEPSPPSQRADSRQSTSRNGPVEDELATPSMDNISVSVDTGTF